MVKPMVDLKGIILDEPTERYLSTKKPSTAGAYKTSLKRFQVFYGKPHGEFLQRIEESRESNKELSITERKNYAEDVIRDYLEWLKEKGYANNPIRGSFTAIQNLLKYYGIMISASFIELPPQVSKKTNNKFAWTTEDLKRFVDAAPNYRDKALITCMFQSGLSVNEICKLNYGDLEKDLESGKLPILIKLIRQKNDAEFKTLFGADAVNYLKLYLGTRNNLESGSPLFTKWATEDRITVDAIESRLRDIAKGLDYVEVVEGEMNPARPHSLRAGFRSRLTGKVDPDLIKSWMGDEIGAKSRAYLNLPDEEHRELYANVEKYLAIETTSKEILEGQPQGDPTYLRDEYVSRLSELEQRDQTLSKWVEKMSRELEGVREENATLKDSMNRLNEFHEVTREMTIEDVDKVTDFMKKIIEDRHVKEQEELESQELEEQERLTGLMKKGKLEDREKKN